MLLKLWVEQHTARRGPALAGRSASRNCPGSGATVRVPRYLHAVTARCHSARAADAPHFNVRAGARRNARDSARAAAAVAGADDCIEPAQYEPQPQSPAQYGAAGRGSGTAAAEMVRHGWLCVRRRLPWLGGGARRLRQVRRLLLRVLLSAQQCAGSFRHAPPRFVMHPHQLDRGRAAMGLPGPRYHRGRATRAEWCRPASTSERGRATRAAVGAASAEGRAGRSIR